MRDTIGRHGFRLIFRHCFKASISHSGAIFTNHLREKLELRENIGTK